MITVPLNKGRVFICLILKDVINRIMFLIAYLIINKDYDNISKDLEKVLNKINILININNYL